MRIDVNYDDEKWWFQLQVNPVYMICHMYDCIHPKLKTSHYYCKQICHHIYDSIHPKLKNKNIYIYDLPVAILI